MKQMALATEKGFEERSRVMCKAEFLERVESAMPWGEPRLRCLLLEGLAMLAMLNVSKWRRPFTGEVGSV